MKTSDIAGTDPEAGFDRLVRLAATALAAPIALFSLVGETRIWRKARVGDVADEVAREGSICSHAVTRAGVLIVEDASLDPRFQRSTLVTGHGMRFYAGAAVRLAGGEAVGVLCVLDSVPRPCISPSDAALLEGLAAAAGHLLDLRRELVARCAAERRLAEEARLLAFAEEMAELGTWRLDLRTGATRHSASAHRIYGCASGLGVDHADKALALYDPADRSRLVEAIDEARATGAGYSLDAKMHRADDGVRRDVRIRARVECDVGGQPIALVGVLQDVTRDKDLLTGIQARRAEADRLVEEMRVLATTDALTGLLNRRAFLELADAALARGAQVELVVIDIDHFKSVNDRYGHSGGDLVLTAFGRICAATAASAVIGRIGGEEFALLVEGEKGGTASALVGQLRLTLAAGPLVVSREVSLSLTISAGLARSCRGDDWSSLFGRADRALYEAKRDGRDRLSVAA